MSTFKETITLTNAKDEVRVEAGILKEVRRVTLDARVDTAAWTLVINEEVRAKLGLKLENSVLSTLADGTKAEYPVTEGVDIRWQDREFTLRAQVVPTACYPATPDSLGVCGMAANSTECFWMEFCQRQNSQANPQRGLALFGAFAMEALDLITDPVDECLRGRHGDKPLYWLKGIRPSR